MNPSDDRLRSLLSAVRTIALVGFSPNPMRPSHSVASYLAGIGYRVIPVNPGQAGRSYFGETVCADLRSIPPEIEVDMVDIFRRSEHVPPIVDEALERFPALKVIWMQIGVEHAAAARTARERGVDVVQNVCPKIEYPRLLGTRRVGAQDVTARP